MTPASTEEPAHLSRDVIARCRRAGFALASVCEARPSERRAEMEAWLAAGKHGSMDWLAEHLDARLDPSRMLRDVRSIIMVADLYAQGTRDDPLPDEPTDAPRGRIARYARGGDYHDIIKDRLHALADDLRERFPDHHFRTLVDVMPFTEREHAARAGLGWIGKHTLLIHPRFGSWFLLGGVLTSLELRAPDDHEPVVDACGTCTRCIDACPTGAITPYSVDASRCVSYLTIERRLPIDSGLFRGVGEWLFGCDICQEVCPHNRERPVEHAPNPAYAPRRTGFDLLEVIGWDEAARRSATRRSAMRRATLAMWKRNAVIAAGNHLASHAAPALRARIEDAAWDAKEDPMVRRTARAVLDRLSPRSGSSAELPATISHGESDP